MNVAHVAIKNFADQALDQDLALIVEAVRAELPRFCSAWSLPLPGIAFYGIDARDDPGEEALVSVVASTGDPSAFARHTALGKEVFSYVDADVCATYGEPIGRALSHELWELLVDPMLDRWIKQPDGSEVAVEVSDPVNRVGVSVQAEFFGRSSAVSLSNYILPSWYVIGSTGPFDRAGMLARPLQDAPSGYHSERRGGAVATVGAARVTSYGRTARRLLSPARP